MTRDHDEEVYVALHDAFDAAKRALEDDIRRRRGAVKAQDIPLHGRIARLDMDRGHSYIETAEGDEVYFGRDNVAGLPF